jgi:hypothetical protein
LNRNKVSILEPTEFSEQLQQLAVENLDTPTVSGIPIELIVDPEQRL